MKRNQTRISQSHNKKRGWPGNWSRELVKNVKKKNPIQIVYLTPGEENPRYATGDFMNEEGGEGEV